MRAELQESEAVEQQIGMHPGAAEYYRRLIVDLQAHLAGVREGRPQPSDAVLAEVRKLVDGIGVFPNSDTKKPANLVVRGRLAE